MSAIDRRSLLGSAAVGAGALAYASLPAWARVISSHGTLRRPDSLPFPKLAAGTETMPKIQHVVVLMMENHSFDNVLGMLGHEMAARRGAVDGLTLGRHGRPRNFNRDHSGRKVFAAAATSPCQPSGVPTQTWNASHRSYANGANSGFVKASGPVAMRFLDRQQMPFSYSLAAHFPIGQRYFSSVLAQTFPNRRFLFAGTASGLTVTNQQQSWALPAANGTIFDRLTAHGIEWISYTPAPIGSNASIGIIKSEVTAANLARVRSPAQFHADAKAGTLPPFSFIDPDYTYQSEENPQDVQVGERFVSGVVHALMNSPAWHATALFITYDEGGGYYDHVPPPRAIKPDDIAPIRGPGAPPLAPGGFDRYGFRVPLYVVSPWARANYVSNVVQDHTSLTAFIERKWNLPAMTFRDANAHPMTDYFDFRKPAFATPPKLAPAPGLAPGLRACHAHGYNPPLPPGVTA
jgi:phospholipase C